MSVSVVLITEIIAPYRIPVFNALARHRDLDLHVIFLAENDPTRRQWRIYKNEIGFSYEVLPSYRRRIANQNLLLNWGLTAALRKCAPAAIVCGGYNYLASWISRAWAHRHRVPFFTWVESNGRDIRRHGEWAELLKRKFLRGCAGYVVAGHSSFEYLRIFNLPREKTFTAPNAVDTDFFARRSNAARRDPKACRQFQLPERFFLFVGRLVAEKGIFDLVRAYSLLPASVREDIALVIAGDGPARSQLAQAATRITPGAIHFAGFVQREDLPTYYAGADAFVFPTHSDAWGLVVNEAMACGLPVICSSAAGCVENLVQDQWNGRVVPPRAAAQLAEAMLELATDAALRAAMGERSRERIAEHSPEACAAGIAAAVLSPYGSSLGRIA